MMQPLLALLAAKSELSTDELIVVNTVTPDEKDMPSTRPTILVDPADDKLASTVVEPAPAAAVEMTYHGAILVEPGAWATAPSVLALDPGPRTTPDDTVTLVVGFATDTAPMLLAVEPAPSTTPEETVTAVVGLPMVTVCCDDSDTDVVGLLTVTAVVGLPTVTVCWLERLTDVVGFDTVTAVVGFVTVTAVLGLLTVTAVVGLATVTCPTSLVEPAEVRLTSAVVEPPAAAVERPPGWLSIYAPTPTCTSATTSEPPARMALIAWLVS